MSTERFILCDRAFSSRRISKMRREQPEAIRKARGKQSTLFELHEDRRPASQRTTAGRYAEPTFLETLQDG